MIVEEAAKVTVERGAKKVEAYHLCVYCYFDRDLGREYIYTESMRSKQQRCWIS